MVGSGCLKEVNWAAFFHFSLTVSQVYFLFKTLFFSDQNNRTSANWGNWERTTTNLCPSNHKTLLARGLIPSVH